MSPSSSASRRDRQDRAGRLEQVRREQRSAERRRTFLILGTASLLVLAIAGAVTFAVLRERANRPSLAAVKTYKVEASHVTTPVKYEQTPPVGGDHNPAWLNCGVYDKPVASENAVHSMEHGAVWVTYRPDLPADQIEALRKSLPSTYVVLSPFEGLPSPVVVSSWATQLQLSGAQDKRLAPFIRAYRQGPATPEPGASCTGGTDGTTTGTPQGPAPANPS